ncbi:MAG: hypothetical protein H0U97_19160 [Gammaproteobacteria bacterium]|nr:hypothetical protein [Gammaproteobacteria bacterium]
MALGLSALSPGAALAAFPANINLLALDGTDGFRLSGVAAYSRSRTVPPTINDPTPDPACDPSYTPNQPRELKVDAVRNNALGFGGHNGSLVAKRFV